VSTTTDADLPALGDLTAIVPAPAMAVATRARPSSVRRRATRSRDLAPVAQALTDATCGLASLQTLAPVQRPELIEQPRREAVASPAWRIGRPGGAIKLLGAVSRHEAPYQDWSSHVQLMSIFCHKIDHGHQRCPCALASPSAGGRTDVGFAPVDSLDGPPVRGRSPARVVGVGVRVVAGRWGR
jgi:hypothetical protein